MSPSLGSSRAGAVAERRDRPRLTAGAADARSGVPDEGGAGSRPPGSGDAGPALRVLAGRRAARLGLAAVVPLALLGLWYLLTSVTGTFASYQLPSPQQVWQAGADLLARGDLQRHIAISTQRVLLGFTAGALAGVLVGAVVGLSPLAGRLLAGTLGAVRAVPSLAWVPLLLLWMGINEDSKVTLIAIGAFFPVYTTLAAALRHVDPHLVEVGRAYGLRGPVLFARIQLPAVTPSLVSGLRLALAQSWLFLVAAELLASSMGLGFLLIESQNNGRVDRILLAIVALALLGKLTDALLGVIERRVVKQW